MTKLRTIKARMSGTSVVMSLTEFVEENVTYNVREVDMNGHKAVLIYEPIENVCPACGEEFLGDETTHNRLCNKCEKHISEIPGGI